MTNYNDCRTCGDWKALEDNKNTNEYVSQDKLNSYCGCSWDDLISKYSIEQISKMGNEYYSTGKYPQGMLEAINNCVWTMQ